MRIVFELESEDVARFRVALARAHAAVVDLDECDILAGAKQALDALPLATAPAFVRRRLGEVQGLIAMLEDEAWVLPAHLRALILPALAYLGDPEDLIPDHLASIGLFDDAIMLELLLIEERPILQAYADFCAYRADLPPACDTSQRRVNAAALARRRGELLERLRPVDPLAG